MRNPTVVFVHMNTAMIGCVNSQLLNDKIESTRQKLFSQSSKIKKNHQFAVSKGRHLNDRAVENLHRLIERIEYSGGEAIVVPVAHWCDKVTKDLLQQEVLRQYRFKNYVRAGIGSKREIDTWFAKNHHDRKAVNYVVIGGKEYDPSKKSPRAVKRKFDYNVVVKDFFDTDALKKATEILGLGIDREYESALADRRKKKEERVSSRRSPVTAEVRSHYICQAKKKDPFPLKEFETVEESPDKKDPLLISWAMKVLAQVQAEIRFSSDCNYLNWKTDKFQKRIRDIYGLDSVKHQKEGIVQFLEEFPADYVARALGWHFRPIELMVFLSTLDMGTPFVERCLYHHVSADESFNKEDQVWLKELLEGVLKANSFLECDISRVLPSLIKRFGKEEVMQTLGKRCSGIVPKAIYEVLDDCKQVKLPSNEDSLVKTMLLEVD